MSRGDAVERMGMAITRARSGFGSVLLRSGWSRVVVGVFLVVLAAPLLFGVFGGSTAFADDNASEEEDNYSLYQLASNGAGYFSDSHEPGESLGGAWEDIAESDPGAAGSLLGYGDPTASQFKRWLSAGLSGSTQTITHQTLSQGGDAFLAYGQFGAANKDLGFDSMSSGVIGDILGGFAGSVVWACYGVALLISGLFFAFIELLKFLNPFAWFYTAVAGVTTSEGTSGDYQQGLADGMLNCESGGDCGPPGAFSGIATFIGEWYGTLVDLSWNFLVPLFLAFLLIGLVLFKKMDRGSAIKKFVVRILFLGLGLPIFGSMYTAVLDGFSESEVDASAGATQVVLSNYVDFNAWAMNSRLLVPEDVIIGWNAGKGQTDPKSTMSARSSALAINIVSHPAYRDAGWDAGGVSDNAEDTWKDASNVDLTQEEPGSWQQVATTLDILNRYISGQETPASDFESGVKSWLSENADEDVKEDWFNNTGSYGDVERFGDEDDPEASEAPMISTQSEGLQSEVSDGVRTFTTKNQEDSAKTCGFMVTTDNGEDPAKCSMSPLSMYNYLNSSFSSDSITSFSSENAMSGLVRENHSSVSQVGSGPASFMYWANSVTLLGSICLLGIWYAFGMVIGALKRTFSLIAAIPFATLGAIAAISKVIIYSVAMILEVILTIFLYQLVSRLIIGVPSIASGPLTNLVTENGLLSTLGLGPVAVVVLTFLSTLLIIAVTFILLRVRKTVLQALDEAVTKLVDKFLETDTAPKAKQGGPMQAAAGGLGTGAGMAAGNKLAQATGGKLGGLKKPNGNGQPGPGGGDTNKPNAGGIPSNAQLEGGNVKALESGQPGLGEQGPGTKRSPQGGPGTFNGSRSSSNEHNSAGQLEQSEQSTKGGPLQLPGAPPASTQEAKAKAEGIARQGGLSRLGFDTKDQKKAEIPDGGVTTGDVAGSDPDQMPGGKSRAIQGEIISHPGGRRSKGVEPSADQTNFSGSNPGGQQARSTPPPGSKTGDISVPTQFDAQVGPGDHAGTPGMKPSPRAARLSSAIPLPAGPPPAASTEPAAATPKAPSNTDTTAIGGPSTVGGAPEGNGFSHRYQRPGTQASPGQRTNQPKAREITERPRPVNRPDGS